MRDTVIYQSRKFRERSRPRSRDLCALATRGVPRLSSRPLLLLWCRVCCGPMMNVILLLASVPSAISYSTSSSAPLLVLRGGASPNASLQRRHHLEAAPIGGLSKKSPLQAAAPAKAAAAPAHPERALQLTCFLFVLGLSLTSLAPAPFLVKQLGEQRGMQLLTVLASSSAVAEIGASPLVGGLTDSFGRKPILLGTLCIALLSNLLVAIYPSVPSLALAKFVSAIVIGLFFLTGGAVLADNYRTDQKKLAAVSGILFAVVNLGFGLGVALSGALILTDQPSRGLRGKRARRARTTSARAVR